MHLERSGNPLKSLILAEKPSVARDLAGVLGQFQKKEGYLEGNEYIVTWAVGHLVVLAQPEDYDKQYKKWRLEDLPILPESFILKANLGTSKQFAIVRELLHRKDVEKIICATDAGREGELIFRYIYRLAKCRKPFVRLWLSETTPAAVQRAFADLRPGDQFNCLAAAAEARSQSDWLIGINATRVYTVKYNELLSVGRVQTPTLAIIVHREKEIGSFKPELYWELKAKFIKDDGQVYQGKWFNGEQDRFINFEEAQEILERLVEQPGVVNRVEEKEIVEAPPLLFNLNDLQKEANIKYSLTAVRTLEVAQELYETKKLITYPRTDSRHITQEMAGTIPTRLSALAGSNEYAGIVETTRDNMRLGRRYVDDSKVTDHTALIPTAITPDLDKLTADQRRVYDLIVRRFLAIFFSAARYQQTKVVTETAEETFLTTGRVELAPGWKTVYAPVDKAISEEQVKEDVDTDLLPSLTIGEIVYTKSLDIHAKKTRPPKRYTDAGILAAMEGAGRLIDDRELKDAMHGHGLGTSATRAAIIERLIQVGYIKRDRKNLVPTDKGIVLVDLVPDIIKDPALTGRWEKNLADIEAGCADAQEFLTGINQLTRKIVALAQQPILSQVHFADSCLPAKRYPKHNNEANHNVPLPLDSLGKCPLCGREVVEKPKFYSCVGYKQDCTFIIGKTIAGKKISRAQVTKLLIKGHSSLIKGFTAKVGTKFDAVLVVKNGRVEFQFSNNEDKHPIGKCPLCGRAVLENTKGYGCSGYKAGCKMVIWKNISGRQISPEQAKGLLEKGSTGVLEGFTSRSGKAFAAALVIGPDGKVEFDFRASLTN